MNDEKYFEKKLKIEVEKKGGYAIKFWCLTFTGMPDRLVLLPEGRIWFVELKSPGKKPSPRQKTVIALLIKLGFKVRIIDSNETLQNFLKEIE